MESLFYIGLIIAAFIVYAIFDGLRRAPKATRQALEGWRAESKKKHEEARREIDKELEVLFPKAGEPEVEDDEEYTHIVLEDIDA